MKNPKTRTLVIAGSLMCILTSTGFLLSSAQSARNLDHANQESSRQRPRVLTKSRMFLDISKRLKLKPDQEEKFLVIFTRDKDDFVARRKKEKWSPQEESKQLGDTFKKMISDSKDILTKEQYATLRHLFATVY